MTADEVLLTRTRQAKDACNVVTVYGRDLQGRDTTPGRCTAPARLRDILTRFSTS